MAASMADPNQLVDMYMGKLVPYSFNGGFVCLSYGISLIGTGTSLELIRRRTSHRGLHNLLLLVGAAIAMGGIAIWSMSQHFIGNRAIYMLDGEETLQIAYSTVLTVMSLLLPILVLILAFLGVSGNGRIRWWRVLLAGMLSGGAICGMHYLANASIANYASSYQLSYLIGSVIIAALASTTALALFFVFENTWSNAWWKRLGCAMVLAGAVSGMHWCAAVGTSYRLLMVTPGKGVSRQDSMIVVICLAISAGVVMTALAIYSSWLRRDYASKSQQVVLAAGVFDDKGRIMVTQDGYLPSEVVTDTYLPKSNDDIFNTNHTLFHWMFRASRNWDTITTIMAKMTSHIAFLAQGNNMGRAGVKLIGIDGLLVDDYDTILRELFCVTAEALASKTKESLKNVGTLWDEIFVTGETHASPRRPILSTDKFSLHGLAEKGYQPHAAAVQEYGRGCLMFLVRRVDAKRDVERLEAAGYRFAEVHQVVGSIRSSMHIKTPDLESRLRNMSNQKDKTTLLSSGVHVGMFAVRARLDRTGFDLLAQKTAKNLLPCVPLPMPALEPVHVNFLRSLGGLTLAAILVRIEKQLHFASTEEKTFATQLREAISTLRDFLGDEAFDQATLLPKEVELPCRGQPKSGSGSSDGESESEKPFLSKCNLIAFQLVLPIHASPLAPQCEFTPLAFFKMRQLTYEGSSHHVDFSHMVHRDVASALHGATTRQAAITGPQSQMPSQMPLQMPSQSQLQSHVQSQAPPTRSARFPSLSHAVEAVREKVSDRRRHHHRRRRTSCPSLPSTRSQEQLSKVASSRSSLYRGADGSSCFEDDVETRTSSAASHSSALKEIVTSKVHKPRSSMGDSQFHAFGGIMVSQEVSINVQETHRSETPFQTPEYNGAEMSPLRPRADTQPSMLERSYIATASGNLAAMGQGRNHEAAFVDELLSLTMKADKRGML
ncbi:hypothetical protein E4U54_004033 [Claviceps lovelessii]|nr:hypothetical protein E4U54_004033 [Claviceps lovelessii]